MKRQRKNGDNKYTTPPSTPRNGQSSKKTRKLSSIKKSRQRAKRKFAQERSARQRDSTFSFIASQLVQHPLIAELVVPMMLRCPRERPKRRFTGHRLTSSYKKLIFTDDLIQLQKSLTIDLTFFMRKNSLVQAIYFFHIKRALNQLSLNCESLILRLRNASTDCELKAQFLLIVKQHASRLIVQDSFLNLLHKCASAQRALIHVMACTKPPAKLVFYVSHLERGLLIIAKERLNLMLGKAGAPIASTVSRASFEKTLEVRINTLTDDIRANSQPASMFKPR